jgi:hypothetical protein
MFLLDGKRLQPGTPFTHGDLQYPANWLQLATSAEKEALGITEVAEQTRPDDRFYWVQDNNDGTFTSNPKLLEDREEEDEDGNPLYVKVYDEETESMVDSDERMVTRGLKTQWISTVKNISNSLLSPTDWYVIRKYESNTAIPTNIATFRTAVKTECDRLETAITTTADVEELIEVVSSQNWPNK